jgi:hypothetical protein
MFGLLTPLQSAADFRRDATFSEWRGVMDRIGAGSASPAASPENVVRGDGQAKGLGDHTNTSNKGFVDGLATFGMNALGVAAFGPATALGIGLGVARNDESLSMMSAVPGLFGQDDAGDPSPGMGSKGATGPDAADASGPDGAGGGVGGKGSSADPSGNPGKGDNGTGMGVDSGGGGDGPGSDGSGDGGSGEGGGDGGFTHGGLVDGPGDGNDDAVKTKLSDGEYVLPAKIAGEWLPLLEHLRQTGELPDDPAAYRTRDAAHRKRLDAELAQRSSSPARMEQTRGKGLLTQ